MRFFTLIHISRNEKSLHNNNVVKSFDEQILLYFTCACRLHLSLKAAGLELIIITNDKNFLQAVNKDNYQIEIEQTDFSLEVPSGVKFFSAHFKIELYKYLSALKDEYIGLIDCDIVCINPMPECFKNVISYKVPLYYDITDQVTPAYGQNRVINDKEKVSNKKSIGLWAGGEFIAGPPDFFGKLYEEIDTLKSNYFLNMNSLHHQSDEVLTSVAIENIRLNESSRLLDAGALSIIARFWSPKTLHVQKGIDAFSDHFLIHLPSDKKFITKLKKDQLQGSRFFKAYKQHLLISKVLENAFKSIKPLIKKISKKING